MKLWPILAAVFGPGVAQALVGRRRTAIGFAAAFALAVLALAFTIYGIAIAGAVWVVSIVDTIVYVVRTPNVTRDRSHEAALVWVALLVTGGVTKLFLAEAFRFPSSSMMPTLEIDDSVFISKVRSYSRGDLIVFVQPCQSRDYGKRIVALANDTVELRCHQLYINGKLAPSRLVAAKTTYRDRVDASEPWSEREASRYQETIDGKTFEIFDSIDRPAGSAEDSKDFPSEHLQNCSNQEFVGEPNPKQSPGKIVDTKPDAMPCELQRHYVVPPGHVFVLGDNRSNSNDSRFWGSVPVENIKGRVTGIWAPFARFGTL